MRRKRQQRNGKKPDSLSLASETDFCELSRQARRTCAHERMRARARKEGRKGSCLARPAAGPRMSDIPLLDG